MGGHGGLNILPQKRWNVYNFDNREKVRRDEEAAAKEEQLKREQARRRDTEFRIERLRTARGLAPTVPEPEPEPEPAESEPKTGHINLFEGIRIFDPIKVSENKRGSEKDEFKKNKKMKKEEAPRVVGPEDEKYRLGYGIAGKGVKLPWYLERRSDDGNGESGGDGEVKKEEGKKSGKKTLEELREERFKRERREKERERALMAEKSRRDKGFSRRNLVHRYLQIELTKQRRRPIKLIVIHYHIKETGRQLSGNAMMPILNEKSLLHTENLTPPSVVVLTANMGCKRCRQRVSQVASKMTGLKEYTVDVHNRQVIMRADLGLHWKVENDPLNKSEMNQECRPLTYLLKTFRSTCFGNHLADQT